MLALHYPVLIKFWTGVLCMLWRFFLLHIVKSTFNLAYKDLHSCLFAVNIFFKSCRDVFLDHAVQRRMISMDNFFVFLRLLFFVVLLLYVT